MMERIVEKDNISKENVDINTNWIGSLYLQTPNYKDKQDIDPGGKNVGLGFVIDPGGDLLLHLVVILGIFWVIDPGGFDVIRYDSITLTVSIK